jgi:IclR family acetate operon transcriptional repressor
MSGNHRHDGHGAPSAIAKVVLVVEALTAEHRLSDVARATGLPTSTVHRILQELAQLGWVHETGDRGYALGARLLGLVGQAGDESQLARLGRPIISALCEQTGHTIHLAVRQGDEAVYVEKLDGRRAYQMRSRIGLSIPLHNTAIGKAVLAELPDEAVLEIGGRTGLPRRTPHTITDCDELLRHLRTVRRLGFAIDDQENELHTRCIGAAVVDSRGAPIGALSLSSLTFDLDDKEIRRFAPLVVAAGKSLSTALGGATQPRGGAGRVAGAARETSPASRRHRGGRQQRGDAL